MSEPASRRALLISISDYPYPGWELEGCANDVVLMYRALTQQFGFEDENITTLQDDEATRDGILAALEQLVTSTQSDDIVVIHYAGHGSQMTCREGDEPDGLDETLVPWDSGRDPHPNRDITDDELHVFLQRLGEKTRYTTLIFDCCHSGTITRNAFGGKTRAVKPDTRDVDQLPPSPLAAESPARVPSARGPSGWLTLSDKYVLIAGCAEEERSAEKKVGPDTYGALTWYLSQELSKAGPGTTYRDVFEGMTSRVTANCALQHPQMEGQLDRELFGVRDIEPIRYVLVSGRDADVVELAAGAAHGLTIGSRWGIVAAGTGQVDSETPRLGEVEIVSVGPAKSRARISGGDTNGAIEPGCRAIETAHAHGDVRLTYELVARGAADSSVLRRALAASALLTEAGPDLTADIRIYVLEARPDAEDPAPDLPVPQLRDVRAGTLAAVGEQGELVVPVERVGAREGPDGHVLAFVDNLEALASFRKALAIENPNPISALRGTVSMEFLQSGPGGEMQTVAPDPETGRVVFEEGEVFTLRIENDGPGEVYFNLLDFDPAGAVSLVFPLPGANDKLAPGGSLSIRLAPSLPEKLPDATLGKPGRPMEGSETFKLFVTREPADFSFLLAGGFRSDPNAKSDGERSPIESLMRSATGKGDAVAPPIEDDWTTVERTFLIRRAGTTSL